MHEARLDKSRRERFISGGGGKEIGVSWLAAQTQTQVTQTTPVVFFIPIEEYEEIVIKGREWWEELKRRDGKLEWSPVHEVIVIKKASEDKEETKNEIEYSDWGIPLKKTVYRMLHTNKKYIIFKNFDDAINLNIENAEFADELPENANAIELPLYVNAEDFHDIYPVDLTEIIIDYFKDKYGNLKNVVNENCELKVELDEIDMELFEYVYENICYIIEEEESEP